MISSLLIVITGVHYLTGHVFDMKTITAAAHRKVINSKIFPGGLFIPVLSRVVMWGLISLLLSVILK